MENLNIDDDMLNFFSDYNVNINNLVSNNDINNNKNNTITNDINDNNSNDTTTLYNDDLLMDDDLINNILNDNDQYNNINNNVNNNNSNNTSNTSNINNINEKKAINEFNSNTDDYYRIKKYELIDKNNYIDFKELDIELQDELINELNINGDELKNELLLLNYKLFHMANLLKIKEECCKKNIIENKNNHKTKNNHKENNDDSEEDNEEVELSANDIELILEIENNLNYELFENIVSYCDDNNIIIKNKNNIHKKVKNFRLIEDNNSLKMNGFIKYIIINKNKNDEYFLDIKTGCFIKYSDDGQKILITLDYKHFFYISKYRIIFKKIKIEDIIYLTDKYS